MSSTDFGPQSTRTGQIGAKVHRTRPNRASGPDRLVHQEQRLTTVASLSCLLEGHTQWVPINDLPMGNPDSSFVSRHQHGAVCQQAHPCHLVWGWAKVEVGTLSPDSLSVNSGSWPKATQCSRSSPNLPRCASKCLQLLACGYSGCLLGCACPANCLLGVLGVCLLADGERPLRRRRSVCGSNDLIPQRPSPPTWYLPSGLLSPCEFGRSRASGHRRVVRRRRRMLERSRLRPHAHARPERCMPRGFCIAYPVNGTQQRTGARVVSITREVVCSKPAAWMTAFHLVAPLIHSRGLWSQCSMFAGKPESTQSCSCVTQGDESEANRLCLAEAMRTTVSACSCAIRAQSATLSCRRQLH